MDQTIHFNQREIPVKATLDVDAVEGALNELWRESVCTSSTEDEDVGALLRTRVLNLMFYLTRAEAADEVKEILAELTTSHPCRALLMIGESEVDDRDIEMSVATYCQESGAAPARRVCCEQATLRACGRFTVELPSAATPLLVSDLPVFLYWRPRLRPDDEIFRSLSRAADRVVIDSVNFPDPLADLAALVQFFARGRSYDVTFSDLNWSRLTSWRALLASFYDVQEYRDALAQLSHVTIEYVAPATADGREVIAPQALMLAGWLASRLEWRPAEETAPDAMPDAASSKAAPEVAPGTAPGELAHALDENTRAVMLSREGRRVLFEFRRVERPEMKRGRLARVELRTEAAPMSTFSVSRSEDGLYLETRAARDGDERATRVLKVRNRSAAVLLGRELEIICRDEVYEDAVKTAARMVKPA